MFKTSQSSHDSTYKTDMDTRLMEAGMPKRCMMRTFLWAVERAFRPR